MAPSTPKAVLEARGAGAVGWVAVTGGMVTAMMWCGVSRYGRRRPDSDDQSGRTAVTSISTLARASTSAATCTQVMAGKLRPMISR